MAEKLFDGFDHTQDREKVERRWGANAYSCGDSWWRGLSAAGLDACGTQAQARDACGTQAQALAERQFDWLRDILGTSGGGEAGPPKELVHRVR
jgi:hypothetical protein